MSATEGIGVMRLQKTGSAGRPPPPPLPAAGTPSANECPCASTISATGSRRSASAPGFGRGDRAEARHFAHRALPLREGRSRQDRDAGEAGRTAPGLGADAARRRRRIIASAVSYFERMRQIEETAEHIIVLAGPISSCSLPMLSMTRSARCCRVRAGRIGKRAGARFRRSTTDRGAAPAQGNLSAPPAGDRQSDLGARDRALPAKRFGRPARPAGQCAASAARSPAPRPNISPR